MRKMLIEQLATLKRGLPKGVMLSEWMDNPDRDPVNDFKGGLASKIDMIFAFGYLQGCADYADRTVLELLDEYDIDLDKDVR